jgi:hypothetical protein
MKIFKLIILIFFLGTFYVPRSFAQGNKKMLENSENIQIELNQSKTTISGLTIEFVKDGFDSNQPSSDNPKISAPASSLMKFFLKLSHGTTTKEITLSFSVGMLYHDREEFEGFRIIYIHHKSIHGKSNLILKIEKLNL